MFCSLALLAAPASLHSGPVTEIVEAGARIMLKTESRSLAGRAAESAPAAEYLMQRQGESAAERFLTATDTNAFRLSALSGRCALARMRFPPSVVTNAFRLSALSGP